MYNNHHALIAFITCPFASDKLRKHMGGSFIYERFHVTDEYVF